MGQLYLARDAKMESEVVIKRLRPPKDGNREIIGYLQKRMFEEARLLYRLSHRNLPKVMDCFEENGDIFVVMEYIRGKDLSEVLRDSDKGGIDPDAAMKWLKELLEVLNFLHIQDPPVIHRDIKPGNIMLDETGRLFLVDFGIAKAVHAEENSQTQIGSPGYASPEHFTGKFDQSSDVYSLGAAFYHLVTGVSPRRFSDGENFPPVGKYVSSFPAGLQEILDKMLASDRSARYSDAAEALQDMNAFLKEEYETKSMEDESKGGGAVGKKKKPFHKREKKDGRKRDGADVKEKKGRNAVPLPVIIVAAVLGLGVFLLLTYHAGMWALQRYNPETLQSFKSRFSQKNQDDDVKVTSEVNEVKNSPTESPEIKFPGPVPENAPMRLIPLKRAYPAFEMHLKKKYPDLGKSVMFLCDMDRDGMEEIYAFIRDTSPTMNNRLCILKKKDDEYQVERAFNLDGGVLKINRIKLVDMAGNGKKQLLTIMDSGSRFGYGRNCIIFYKNDRFKCFDTGAISKFPFWIRDLDGKRPAEILCSRFFVSGEAGVDHEVVWDIYHWSGNNLGRVSSRFKRYYKKQVEKYGKEVVRAVKAHRAGDNKYISSRIKCIIRCWKAGRLKSGSLSPTGTLSRYYSYTRSDSYVKSYALLSNAWHKWQPFDKYYSDHKKMKYRAYAVKKRVKTRSGGKYVIDCEVKYYGKSGRVKTDKLRYTLVKEDGIWKIDRGEIIDKGAVSKDEKELRNVHMAQAAIDPSTWRGKIDGRTFVLAIDLRHKKNYFKGRAKIDWPEGATTGKIDGRITGKDRVEMREPRKRGAGRFIGKITYRGSHYERIEYVMKGRYDYYYEEDAEKYNDGTPYYWTLIKISARPQL